MRIFFLPGLGLDHRVFDQLDLRDLPVTFLDWMDPLEGESIRDYARRMLPDDVPDDEEIILVGYSFGGVVAQEIAAQASVDKIILISSIKSRAELPWNLKITGSLGLYKLIGSKLITSTVSLWGRFYDLDNRQFREAFKTMVSDRSDKYLRWAVYQLATWEAPQIPVFTQICHIHGRRDKTFPIRLTQNPDVVIDKGGHFMVFKNSEEVGREIRRALGV